MSFIDDSPSAKRWVDDEIAARADSPAFGQLISGVVWTDELISSSPVGELEPDDVVAASVGVQLILHHDPGLPVGRVLAAKSFATLQGRRFVAAILGLYTAEVQAGFSAFDLDPNPVVMLPDTLGEPSR